MHHRGMKVICIEQVKNLTLYKVYEIDHIMGPGGTEEYHNSNLLYSIIDDYGYREYYKMCFFMSLGEYRDKRINEIIE